MLFYLADSHGRCLDDKPTHDQWLVPRFYGEKKHFKELFVPKFFGSNQKLGKYQGFKSTDVTRIYNTWSKDWTNTCSTNPCCMVESPSQLHAKQKPPPVTNLISRTYQFICLCVKQKAYILTTLHVLVHTECATITSEYVLLKQRSMLLSSLFLNNCDKHKETMAQYMCGDTCVHYYRRCCFPKKDGLSHKMFAKTIRTWKTNTNQPTDLKTKTPHPFQVIGRFLSHVAGIVLEPCHGKKTYGKGEMRFLGSFYMLCFFFMLLSQVIILVFL